MKFKVDENLPNEVAERLAAAGHDACTIHAQGLDGSEDEVLIPRLNEERRIFVTMDVGVGNMRRFPMGSHAGIVLLRPFGKQRNAVLELLDLQEAKLLRMKLESCLTVVTPDRIRQRQGP